MQKPFKKIVKMLSSAKYRLMFAFVSLGIFSLVLISVVDRVAYQFLKSFNSPWSVVAEIRLTSLALVVVILIYVHRSFPVEKSSIDSKRLKRSLRLAAIWVCGTIYFVLVKKVWVPVLTDWTDYTAFMITGLLAEELLFRGALYNLAVSSFGTKVFAGFSVPVWMTSILFGLQHLGYHQFQVNSASMTQVIYTTVAGLIFCNLRETSGAIWPVILLHVVTNSFTLIRNLGWI